MPSPPAEFESAKARKVLCVFVAVASAAGSLMNINAARHLALSLPEAEEHDHCGRPSFRVGKRIFATLWPEDRRAVLKLSPDDQAAFIALKPDCFPPIPGGWGRQGWTNVDLDRVTADELEEALRTA